MDNFLLLAVCFGLGIFLRRKGITPPNAADTLNEVILHVSLPAMALLRVHSLHLSAEYLAPALMGWIVFMGGWALYTLLGRLFSLDPRTVVCLTLTTALGNTVFIGVPFIEAFYGSQWVGAGLIMDQGGNFLAFVLVGIALAAATSGQALPKREIARRILTFPPLLAIFLAVALMPVEYPLWLSSALEKIGSTLAPLAILSVGLTVRFSALRGRTREALFGLGYKLVLAPLLITGIYVGLFGLSGTLIKVTVFEAAMPPMVLGGVLAMQYDLDPDLAGLLVGLGTPLSFATVTGWFWLLEHIA